MTSYFMLDYMLVYKYFARVMCTKYMENFAPNIWLHFIF